MTRQEVKTAITGCARKLGRSPNGTEFTTMTGISRDEIRKHFGRFNNALRSCRLKPSREFRKITLAELFCDWAGVVRKLGRLPAIPEYRKLGHHTDSPLRARCGSWNDIGRTFREFAKTHGQARQWRDVLEIIAAQAKPPRNTRVFPDRPVYGALMHACQMAHGPINECGVVYLFGTMAERLGFVVMQIQSGFPDCEAMRRIDQFRWQRVFIEFEYESRNYRRHRHPMKGCDLIVCWKHNWPECPFEVLELSTLLGPRFAPGLLARRSRMI